MSTIDGNTSGNGESPKGSIDNPYTEAEFNNMCNAGTWTGGYVEGIGYCLPNAEVTASWSGSDFDFDSWDPFFEDDPLENEPNPLDNPENPNPQENPDSPNEHTSNNENPVINTPDNPTYISGGSSSDGQVIGKTEWDELLQDLANITSSSISIYTANKYYQNPLTGAEIWVTAKGKVYDSSVLKPRPNGKYIQGVQGIRISKGIAQESIASLKHAADILGWGLALYDGIKFLCEPSIEQGITTLREALSAYYLPYALTDFYISAMYDAMVRIQNGTATYNDIMMLTTGYPTPAAYTESYQYHQQIKQYLQQINNK